MSDKKTIWSVIAGILSSVFAFFRYSELLRYAYSCRSIGSIGHWSLTTKIFLRNTRDCLLLLQ